MNDQHKSPLQTPSTTLQLDKSISSIKELKQEDVCTQNKIEHEENPFNKDNIEPEPIIEDKEDEKGEELLEGTNGLHKEEENSATVEPENPKFVNIGSFNSVDQVNDQCSDNVDDNYTPLKFELSFSSKKASSETKPLSTFAELSNKLGPTVNLHHRKLATVISKPEKPTETVIERQADMKENGFEFDVESANCVAEDMDIDDDEDQEESKIETRPIEVVEEEDDEVVYVETRKSRSKSKSRSYSRSRSRSYSYSSRSRSRSYSYSSYSRSRSRSRRSRSYSRSRSRSRSYSYSSYSSRSRSRSPSIVRRRGSPSFLDKRRITSARKRPIPYHRKTPSPSPSDSDSSEYSRSPSPNKDRKRKQ